MSEEIWMNIPEFPSYEVSNRGRIYNSKHRQMMQISFTNHGHSKITLTTPTGVRLTRSAALLVADAFVEVPNILCDTLIVLDGNFNNISASNLAWRPRWFAWKYTRQLKVSKPLHYLNLRVRNVDTGVEYRNIEQAGMTEGLLFNEIWESTYNNRPVYPYGHVFEVIERV